jgi:hypothetical protein
MNERDKVSLLGSHHERCLSEAAVAMADESARFCSPLLQFPALVAPSTLLLACLPSPLECVVDNLLQFHRPTLLPPSSKGVFS